MKRLICLLILASLALTACGGKNEEALSAEESAPLFADFSQAAELDTEWLFLPEKAELLRTAENRGVLEATFKGCEYPEINAYTKALFNSLKHRGAEIYDAYDLFKPLRLEEFREAELDIRFAGVAYRYYYTCEDKIFMLELKYYGSAGGAYGNGRGVIGISDVSEKVYSLIYEE